MCSIISWILLAINFCVQAYVTYSIKSQANGEPVPAFAYTLLAMSLYGIALNDFIILLILTVSWFCMGSYIIGSLLLAQFVFSLCGLCAGGDSGPTLAPEKYTERYREARWSGFNEFTSN